MSFDPYITRRITWGITTRSGRRWFWAAVSVDKEERELHGKLHGELHGWTDTEQKALDAGKAAIDQLAEDAVQVSVQRSGLIACDVLKEVNQAKRAARPAPASRPAPKTKGSAFVEYLYAGSYGSSPERFQITKKTAKRIYILRWGETLNFDGSLNDDYRLDEEVCFIDRKKVETDTGVWHRRMYRMLYMTFEASLSWQFKDKREQAGRQL